MKKLLLIISLSILTACSSSNSTQGGQNNVSGEQSKLYGLSQGNPVKLGNGSFSFGEGTLRERKYLNTLMGPNGEKINYRRLESCCFFKSPHAYNNGALLEKYEVTYAGLQAPITLYLNMYDPGNNKAPHGLKLKN